MFSPIEISMSRSGTYAIESIPISLFGETLSRLKVAKIYHSGRISKGVAKGSADSEIPKGWLTDRLISVHITPVITVGNIYKMSLGHASLKHN